MAKPRGNPDKLVPFKKGDDERRNMHGNPGSVSLKSILDRLLAKQIKVEEDGAILTVTRKEAIALNMIATAIGEEDPNIMLKAAKDVFAHTDPITKEVAATVNVTGQTELSPEQAAAILKLARGE